MGELFANGILLPTIVIGMLGFIVPRLWARILPEGVKPLIANAVLSATALVICNAILFFCLYAWQGIGSDTLLQQGLIANAIFFSGLALNAALIWGPVMVLTIANLPRHWVKEVW